jgi:hypothetical protein
VRDIAGTTRLLAAARLDAGLVLACGTHGALLAIDGDEVLDIPWGRTGHLYAAASTPEGGAFVVGSGGHALAIGAPHPSLRGVPPTATLESVQTTRDLHGVLVDPSGTAWAAGAQGRLLVRHAGTWSRVPVELGAAGLIAVAARPPTGSREPARTASAGLSRANDPGPRDARPSRVREVVALAEDGTVVEIALA